MMKRKLNVLLVLVCVLISIYYGINAPNTNVEEKYSMSKKNSRSLQPCNYNYWSQSGSCYYEAATCNTVYYTYSSMNSYAYNYCSQLTYVYISGNLYSVAYYGFRSATGVTTVILSAGVGFLSDYSFAYTPALTNVAFPSSLTYIDWYVFQYSNLYKVDASGVTYMGYGNFQTNPQLTMVLATSLRTAGQYLFSYCTSLTHVNIPNVQTINGYVFYMANLTSINVPYATVISSYAFYSNYYLTSATLSVTNTLGTSAFAYNYRLTSIVLPSGITNLYSSTFFNCISLTSVTLNGYNIMVNSQVFYENRKLREVVNADRITYIADNAFYRCESLTSLEWAPSLNYIGSYAFRDCVSLTKVGPMSSVNYLYAYTFYNNTLLTNINFQSLYYMYDYSAAYCKSLTDITFGSNINYLYTGVFQYSQFNDITMGSNLYTIYTYAFQYSQFNNIKPNHYVQTIYNYAFQGAKFGNFSRGMYSISYYSYAFQYANFTKVEYYGNSIDNYVFSYATMKEFEAPSNLYYIYDASFWYSNIEYLDLGTGNSLTVYYSPFAYSNIGTVRLGFGYHSFQTCAFGTSIISNVIFGTFVTTVYTMQFAYASISNLEGSSRFGQIYYRAFYSATLSNITIPSFNTYIYSEAFATSVITNVKIESTFPMGYYYSNIFYYSEVENVDFGPMMFVPSYMFYYAQKLKSVVLTVVTYIDSYGFYYCTSNTIIDMGNNVYYIGNYAFDYNQNVKTLIFSTQLTQAYYNFRRMTVLKDLRLGPSMTYLYQSFHTSQNMETVYFETIYSCSVSGSFYGNSRIRTVTLPDYYCPSLVSCCTSWFSYSSPTFLCRSPVMKLIPNVVEAETEFNVTCTREEYHAICTFTNTSGAQTLNFPKGTSNFFTVKNDIEVSCRCLDDGGLLRNMLTKIKAGYWDGVGCPAGTYAFQEGVCLTCSEGHYCPFHSTEEIPCPAGKYGSQIGLQNDACSGPCKEGHYCPIGSVKDEEVKCPAGTYGSTTGLPNENCTAPCPAGSYCPEATVTPIPCTSGTGIYCPEGSGTEELCPKGGYCPSTSTRNECPAGKYNAIEGSTSDVCISCPAGTYGIGSSISIECDGLCIPGYFCTSGSTHNESEICPAGTYGETYGLKTSSCSGECLPGYYCEAGSINNMTAPCPAGKDGGRSGLQTNECNGPCPVGFYCPEASPSPINCPKGSYCIEGSALNEVCDQGLYGNEENLETSSCSGVCPIGHYCPKNTSDPIQCPPGRYGDSQGMFTSNCAGDCDKGFYCPAGSISFEEVMCPPGYYGNETGLGTSTCSGVCPRGYYCPENTIEPIICNVTFFCTLGVELEAPCPEGTYGNTTGLQVAECSGVCPIGHYCPLATENPFPCPAGRYGDDTSEIRSNCKGDCAIGHYCPEGSISANENECPAGTYGNVTGLKDLNCSGECPEGHYCPIGTGTPINCPAGYYGNATGIIDPNCTGHCEPSYYCQSPASVPVLCPAGTYGNVSYLSSSSCSGQCEKGYYCPEGSISETSHECPPGKYGSVKGLQNENCSGDCDYGYYCPAGSISNHQIECAAGYYGNVTGLGSSECSGFCPSGHFCPIKTVQPQQCYAGTYGDVPQLKDANCSGDCPIGHYCPQGTVYPNPCPPGTFGATERQASASCSGQCDYGYYCEEASTSSKQTPCPAGTYGDRKGLGGYECSGPCSPGFYCPEASTNSTSVPCPAGKYGADEGLTNENCTDICPKGHYCLEGTEFPEECPEGTYGDSEGLETNECSGKCPRGYYCLRNSVNPTLCPAGTYSEEEAKKSDDCFALDEEIQYLYLHNDIGLLYFRSTKKKLEPYYSYYNEWSVALDTTKVSLNNTNYFSFNKKEKGYRSIEVSGLINMAPSKYPFAENITISLLNTYQTLYKNNMFGDRATNSSLFYVLEEGDNNPLTFVIETSGDPSGEQITAEIVGISSAYSTSARIDLQQQVKFTNFLSTIKWTANPWIKERSGSYELVITLHTDFVITIPFELYIEESLHPIPFDYKIAPGDNELKVSWSFDYVQFNPKAFNLNCYVRSDDTLIMSEHSVYDPLHTSVSYTYYPEDDMNWVLLYCRLEVIYSEILSNISTSDLFYMGYKPDPIEGLEIVKCSDIYIVRWNYSDQFINQHTSSNLINYILRKPGLTNGDDVIVSTVNTFAILYISEIIKSENYVEIDISFRSKNIYGTTFTNISAIIDDLDRQIVDQEKCFYGFIDLEWLGYDNLLVDELGKELPIKFNISLPDKLTEVSLTCTSENTSRVIVMSNKNVATIPKDTLYSSAITVKGVPDKDNRDINGFAYIKCEFGRNSASYKSSLPIRFIVYNQNILIPAFQDVLVLKNNINQSSIYENGTSFRFETAGDETVYFICDRGYGIPCYQKGLTVSIDVYSATDVNVNNDGSIASAKLPPFLKICGRVECGYKQIRLTNPDLGSLSCPDNCPLDGQGVMYINFCEGYETSYTVCMNPKTASQCGYRQSDDSCVNCPTGGLCPGGSRLLPQPGYYVECETCGVNPKKCDYPPERCDGYNPIDGSTRCGEGYDQSTYMCEGCTADYYKSGYICEKCPATSKSTMSYIFMALFLIACILVFFLVPFFSWNMKYGTRFSYAFYRARDLIMFYFVVLQPVAETAVILNDPQISSTIRQFYKLFSIFELNIMDSASPAQCHDSFGKQKFYLAVYIIIIVVFYVLSIYQELSIYFTIDAGEKIQPTSIKYHEIIALLRRYASSWLLILYSTVLHVTLEVLYCKKTHDGKSALFNNPKVECYKGDHTTIALLGWICLIFGIILYPILSVLYLMFRSPHQQVIKYMNSLNTDVPLAYRRSGFATVSSELKIRYSAWLLYLGSDYKPHKFWMTGVYMLLLFVVTITNVMMHEIDMMARVLRLIITLVVCIAYIVLVYLLNVYVFKKKYKFNIRVAALVLVNLLLVVDVLSYIRQSKSEFAMEYKQGFEVIISTVAVILMLYMIALVLIMFILYIIDIYEDNPNPRCCISILRKGRRIRMENLDFYDYEDDFDIAVRQLAVKSSIRSNPSFQIKGLKEKTGTSKKQQLQVIKQKNYEDMSLDDQMQLYEQLAAKHLLHYKQMKYFTQLSSEMKQRYLQMSPDEKMKYHYQMTTEQHASMFDRLNPEQQIAYRAMTPEQQIKYFDRIQSKEHENFYEKMDPDNQRKYDKMIPDHQMKYYDMMNSEAFTKFYNNLSPDYQYAFDMSSPDLQFEFFEQMTSEHYTFFYQMMPPNQLNAYIMLSLDQQLEEYKKNIDKQKMFYMQQDYYISLSNDSKKFYSKLTADEAMHYHQMMISEGFKSFYEGLSQDKQMMFKNLTLTKQIEYYNLCKSNDYRDYFKKLSMEEKRLFMRMTPQLQIDFMTQIKSEKYDIWHENNMTLEKRSAYDQMPPDKKVSYYQAMGCDKEMGIYFQLDSSQQEAYLQMTSEQQIAFIYNYSSRLAEAPTFKSMYVPESLTYQQSSIHTSGLQNHTTSSTRKGKKKKLGRKSQQNEEQYNEYGGGDEYNNYNEYPIDQGNENMITEENQDENPSNERKSRRNKGTKNSEQSDELYSNFSELCDEMRKLAEESGNGYDIFSDFKKSGKSEPQLILGRYYIDQVLGNWSLVVDEKTLKTVYINIETFEVSLKRPEAYSKALIASFESKSSGNAY